MNKHLILICFISLAFAHGVFAKSAPSETSAAQKWFVSFSPVADLARLNPFVPTGEFKLGIPLSPSWHVIIPVRMAYRLLDTQNTVLSSGRVVWDGIFEISSGVGLRYSLPIVQSPSMDVAFFLEPSLRVGYEDLGVQFEHHKGLVSSLFFAVNLQSGVQVTTDFGLLFGGGIGLSAGAFSGFWGLDSQVSPRDRIANTAVDKRFVSPEMFATVGYCW